MQAVFFEQHGGLEVLKFGEFKDPVMGPNDVLVGVKVCALNHLDIWVRQGLPGIPIPLPHIPGSDVSGTVLDFGKGVKRFKKGDRVTVVLNDQTVIENCPLPGIAWVNRRS